MAHLRDALEDPSQVLAIVGVGLIGGSIGLAARRSRSFAKILGIGRDPASLDQSRLLGCIDASSTALETAADADVIVFCTPVDRIAEQVLAVGSRCRPDALLTDAGSTKAGIIAAVHAALPDHVHFVGAHPLAGSEKRGAEYARADLFDDRLTVLTPAERTPQIAVERAREFWSSLGCRTRIMSPEEHDRALALTSHLPHLLAAALGCTLPVELHEVTATGFRDTTRVAAGDPALWAAIFRHNRDAVLDALRLFDQSLTAFREALTTGDDPRLLRLLIDAKRTRDDLGS